MTGGTIQPRPQGFSLQKWVIFWGKSPGDEVGRDPFNQNFRKFLSKTIGPCQNSMDRFGLTGKVSKKLVHLLFWGGPLFAVGPVWILVECRIAPQFRRNFCGWTEPIHWVFDWNFQKFRLNGSRPGAHNPLQYGCQWNMYPLPPPLTPPHTCRFYFCCYEQHNGQKSKDSRQNNRKAVSGEFISS